MENETAEFRDIARTGEKHNEENNESFIPSDDSPDISGDKLPDNVSISTDSTANNSCAPVNIKYNPLNFAYTNARSLPARIPSMVEAFEELDLHFMAISETWFRGSRSLSADLKDLQNSDSIGSIVRNRPRRGGGVGIFFDTRKIKLKQAYPFPEEFEVICAVGKTVLDVRKIVVFSIYLPPKMETFKLTRFNELLEERITRAKEELGNPYIIIAGDLNKKNIACAIRPFPDIELIPTGATRGSACLDLCYSNIQGNLIKTNLCDPLTDGAGVASDHLLISAECRLQRRDNFKKVVTTSRTYSRKGEEKFVQLLHDTDWSELFSTPDPTDAVAVLNRKLAQYVDDCFPFRTYKKKSTDKPWFTKRLASMVRKKKRWYKRRGKGRAWHAYAKHVAEEIELAKGRFANKVKDTIVETGDSKVYWRVVKMLKTDDPLGSAAWNISTLFPEKSDQEIADLSAEYFNRISKEFHPVLPPAATIPQDQLEPPSRAMIERRIKDMKKPRGQVEGDIDSRLLSKTAALLAVPLSFIYKRVYHLNSWRAQWKNETVTLIPKKNTPEELGDLRNLSCTPFFSKLLESFLLDDLKSTVDLSNNQFGGKKGQGVDHLLIDMWNYIHRSLEDPGTAVGIMAVDFHKAFNRMSHDWCLEALTRLGARSHTVALVNSFLCNRMMQVKVNGTLSKKLLVSGGAPKGSLLGCILFCASIDNLLRINPDIRVPQLENREAMLDYTMDDLRPDLSLTDDDDEEVRPFFRWRRNPLDDTEVSFLAPQQEIDTVLGTGPWKDFPPITRGYIDDISVLEKVKITNAIGHYTTQTPSISVHAPLLEGTFQEVDNQSREVGMVINPDKTQLLCITGNTDAQYSCYINTENGRIKSEEKLKVLGFWFDKRPGVHLQVETLLDKAYSTLWSMRKLRRSGLGQDDLLKIYCTMIRPIIDYTVPTYHSQLNQEQSNELERFQATAMKIVFGHRVSYRTVLENDMIEPHFQRRENIVKKFTVKASGHRLFKEKWFPINNEVDYAIRNRKIYLEEYARTNRLTKSPVFAMRRLLNGIENAN